MQLTLVTWSLSAGGAERVMSRMANHWAERGWRVTLLTFDDGSEPPFFDLHPAVRHRPLGLTMSRASVQGMATLLMILRRSIKESAPRVLISFIDRINVMVLLATRGLRLPVIVSERAPPAHHAIGWAWSVLRRRTYPWATRLVVQHPDVLEYFASSVRRKGRVIPNPVTAPLAAAAPRDRSGSIVLAMGRLSAEKGFDVLLQAFSDVAPECPEWTLVIWGEGHLRGGLERLRDKLGLGGRAFLPGRTREPFGKMQQADLFVLPSHWDGFPNVLCEAMASGLPVVSTDCPGSSGRIVRDGVNGILVPPGDPRALAAAMRRLMRDAPGRRRLASRAPEVVERFSLEKVMRAWDTVLHEAMRAYGDVPAPLVGSARVGSGGTQARPRRTP